MIELIKVVSIGVMMLLPLANPLTAIAMYLGLSSRMSIEERKKTASQSAFYTLAILLTTWYLGHFIMGVFGISIPGLQIAGGMIVAFIGFMMLFPPSKQAPEEVESAGKSSSISFVPLAMPATAGPGTIALVISTGSTFHTSSHISEFVYLAAPPIVALLIAALLWIGLRSAATIMRVLGAKGIEAISRLMGFLLVCMGVQFIINGVLAIIHQY
ncbi:MarC family NAAT transporter [Ignatzschineria cameli]|nr:MarC family NAAT transporter [Ignatzschineria cameli]PWD83653.1 stress protection protein MarC [Ignatzschineria cameli]